MHFVRRSAYHTLSSLLFVFLVLGAWTATATLTFSKPDRLESWLSQSKLYDHFVDNAIDQSQKPSEGETNTTVAGAPLSDPAVQQAAKAAFTPSVVQKTVDTFLNANYAWLQGKTPTPEFSIDLTQAKATLATNLGNYAATRAVSLPHCKTLAEVHQAAQDYLSATCIPVTVTPAQVGAAVTEDVATSKDFLANPVITPQTFSSDTLKGDQKSTQPTEPYYVKLAGLPRAYRWAAKLPWIISALVVLCGIGIVFLAATRRKGARRIGTLLISAGVIVLALILISNLALHRIENKVLTNDKLGQLQQSLVDFAHRAQSAFARVDLWFGIGFIATGIAIYLFLKFIHPAEPATKVETKVEPKEDLTPPSPPTKTAIKIQL